jgi:hypothetical protein
MWLPFPFVGGGENPPTDLMASFWPRQSGRDARYKFELIRLMGANRKIQHRTPPAEIVQSGMDEVPFSRVRLIGAVRITISVTEESSFLRLRPAPRQTVLILCLHMLIAPRITSN